ncbi:natural cytotoxicity triggering receptor 1-like isoform X2 [Numida meleagris]|uniref:natural cytotoxicity triggering receptor 1-like isoform X2 n=1 Tax=Numida meleagris TaxID=8996 RepID=UPI000B3E00C2|nr:natural cytotoxicity triggering receptor 1-like isoform X2 [Numida meleagris]
MAPMVLALILGWCLLAASSAQQLPRPSLWLHPSQGVAVGDTVTLRCHLPQLAAWVQLWFNGTLRSDKEKDEEQDTVEFSLVVTNLEDVGTYQCRYQVSEPLWTSNMSDPVELVVTGVPPAMTEDLEIQVSACGSGPQIPTYPLGPTLDINMETQIFTMGTSNDPQPHMAYPDIYVHHPYPDHGNPISALWEIPHPTILNTQTHGSPTSLKQPHNPMGTHNPQVEGL